MQMVANPKISGSLLDCCCHMNYSQHQSDKLPDRMGHLRVYEHNILLKSEFISCLRWRNKQKYNDRLIKQNRHRIEIE